LKSIRTEKRTLKVEKVLRARQDSLMIVLENIHDPHNVSAIFRTCDAAGVPAVSLIYNLEKFPRIGKKSSASAFKWVEKERFNTVESCYTSLRSAGFRIYASALNEDSKNLYDLDLTEKVALVLGNEHRGVSEDAACRADETFMIPMYGMVQSLNVSVAAAVVIYEAVRQRTGKGLYAASRQLDKGLTEKEEAWLKK
jgi:tRNA (guanosine-2'-O-)-methyltransferase